MIRTLVVVIPLIFASVLSSGAAPSAPRPFGVATNSFDVRDFGARGDGKTKDTTAVQRALDACAAAGGGTVVVPAGNYLIGSVVIGPSTTLKLEARANLSGSPDITDYPLVRVRWEGEFTRGHRALLSAEKSGGVAILGRGSIFVPPLSVSSLRNPRGPVLIELTETTNVLLDGFSTQYQQLWSIHLLCCSNLTVRNLTIRSINFNGDGIDLDSCDNTTIEHCSIDTGDDAISLKSGRGLEAVRLSRPTQNVLIRDCSLVSSIYAGLSIGSEMSGGIRNVRIEHCLISGRQNGILLKSRDGRGGFIEDVTGEDLLIRHSPTFLAIDLLKKGIQATEPVPGEVAKWALLRGIRFQNIQVDEVAELVTAKDVPPERPVEGLTLNDITGSCGKGITLANMVDVNLAGINVTGFQGPLVATQNVKGSGLDNPSTPAPTPLKSP